MKEGAPPMTAKQRCWEAAGLLQWMLPKHHSHQSYIAWGLRKLKLAEELAEFDLLHRLQRGRAATIEELSCAGSILIRSQEYEVARPSFPSESKLTVNAQTYSLIAAWVDERMAAAGEQPA